MVHIYKQELFFLNIVMSVEEDNCVQMCLFNIYLKVKIGNKKTSIVASQ